MVDSNAFLDLKYQYEKTMERRNTLTGQASSLMGFASIIDTIVIALLVGIASNKDVAPLLADLSNEIVVICLLIAAFVAYIVTLISALLAYLEPMWKMAPEMPPVNGDYYDAADFFVGHDDRYSELKRAYQLIDAISFTQKINDSKYNCLRFAFLSLMSGIGITTAVGLIILSSVLLK